MELNPAQVLGCSPAFDLGPYIGAMLLGNFISLALWGASLFQMQSLSNSLLWRDRHRNHATVRRSLRIF